MIRLRQALREAGVLLMAAVALGFIYTAAMERGMFARRTSEPPGLSAGLSAPAMISQEQARAYFETGAALFVDARHEFDYKLGHIRGAINIPLRMYEAKKNLVDSIPKNQLLVAYCDGAECNSSIELSVKLAKDGHKNVKIFFGGWRDWADSHLPIVKAP